MERTHAVDRVLEVLETIDREPTPVPIREVWVFGDLALGLDPVDRLDLYLTKDLLFAGEQTDPDAAESFEAEYGVAGIGTTVSAEWAETYPDRIRANTNGHAAPERCLAAHLVDPSEPIHLEVCNAPFEQNVTQRLRGARATGDWEALLDPRGVCLWKDGTRSESAPEKLRSGEYVFPTLPEALEMIGLDEQEADEAAEQLTRWRTTQEGRSVRGDVV